jgi:DNA polymerase-3 subunit delta
MVALKGVEIATYLARPDPRRPIALVFGPDAGLVSERTRAIVGAVVENLDDPFSLVRLGGDELASDPARLIDEANTVPLFAGRRAIWIKAGVRDFAPAIERLVDGPRLDCHVVIEAGDLRRGAPLRALGERAQSVAAIACYGDAERDLSRLVDEEMQAGGLSIAPDARAALLPLLGGDRGASRNELRKLALYARGKHAVELDDVLAVVADASALALDAVVDAAFAGRVGELETQFGKALSAGNAPGRILAAALGQVGQLHRARAAMEAGALLDAAVAAITPKAQFRRKPAVEAALKVWTAARLERAMQQLASAALEVRKLSGSLAPLADSVASRALLAVAIAARRKERLG